MWKNLLIMELRDVIGRLNNQEKNYLHDKYILNT